jgi:hypothetical protein
VLCVPRADTVATTTGAACAAVARSTVSEGATAEEGEEAVAACAPAPASGQCTVADYQAMPNWAGGDDDDSTSATNSCKSTPDAVDSADLLTESGPRFACGVPRPPPQATPA